MNQKALGEAIQAYLKKEKLVTDKRRREKGSFKPTQALFAEACGTPIATMSRKLNDAEPINNDDARIFTATLIWWGLVTRRSELEQLFDLAGYTLPERYWQEEPWKSLPDDTIPLKQPDVLAVQNASFEDWKNGTPTKWLCNTKTGWVKQVQGREARGSCALEVGGNRDNREWVYCRTRETQDIPVVLGSKVKLLFWGRKVQEGKNPERSKYVEVFFHDGSGWVWGFGQDVTNSDDWAHYETEWWDVPATAQKISVGAVVYKDGSFQVDDIALHMRTDK